MAKAKVNKTKHYIAFIQTTRELPTDLLGVVFPDFPGCISAGNTYEEAFKNAHEALALHVEELERQGLKIPDGRSFEEIRDNWEDFKDWQTIPFTVAFISLYERARKKLYTIRLPVELVAKIDERSKNRTDFITDAVGAYL